MIKHVFMELCISVAPPPGSRALQRELQRELRRSDDITKKKLIFGLIGSLQKIAIDDHGFQVLQKAVHLVDCVTGAMLMLEP